MVAPSPPTRSVMLIPRRPRFTSPNLTICSITACAIITGTAKPMPTLPPARPMIAVLMPTSSPLQVHERAAGVARIDRGVGLDEVLVALDARPLRPERAHDARGGGLAQAERIADRDHEVADLRARRNRRTSRRPGSSARPSLRRCRCPGSAPTSFAGSLRLSLQRDRTSRASFDDVRIGHHVAVLRVDDHAGAGGDLRLGLPRARRRSAGRTDRA